MGSEISACCGGSGDRDTQVDFSALPPQDMNPPLAGADTEFTSLQIEEFREKLYEGIDVHLILQDKSKLVCQVQLDRSHEFLLLSCDKKVRAINMKDIKAILHTAEQLKRVESSAGITEVETCAAIHLAASGNCIPLFFINAREKALFLQVIHESKGLTKQN